MKFLTLNGFLRIGVLTLVLMLSAGPVSAQAPARTPTVTERDVARTTTTERDNDTDWGWIGLLGLLGLAGLLPKKRTIDHDRIDPNNRTTTR